jgi:ABC-type dipeptide/oligopeptide/nickel transport system permease subunit
MVASEAGNHSSGIDFSVRKERSPWGAAWRQLIKNKVAVVSGVFLLVLVSTAVFANFVAPYHYAEGNLQANYALPGKDYWLGADFLGRDMLSRTIYGSQVSLAVGFVGAFVSMIIGMVYGLISGYSSSRVDNIMMRVVDFLYAMPILIFVILLQVYFKAVSRQGAGGPLMHALVDIDTAMGGMFFIFIAIGMLNWLGMARIMRGQVLSYKRKEFVEAARSIGSSNGRIIFKHLLPNALGPCIVAETLAIPGYISLEAFLSFLGLGVNAPRPSWGMMISEGYKGLRSYPHLLLAPAVALTLTILAFNFLGDGLRDAFDPRLRGQ